MNIESFEALRRANPRANAGFSESVAAAAEAVQARIMVASGAAAPAPARNRRRMRLSAAPAVTAVAAVVALSTVGSPGDRTSVENATAAVRKAATVTAASAERSGTVVVRLTRDGRLWAGSTLRWHDDDVSMFADAPRRRGRPRSELLVVGGTMYGVESGRWVVLGDPASIDPGSGTTPAEYLTAVREDVGGATLRRISGAMSALTTVRLEDGSTVYRGGVAARVVARETGFKEGNPIRVLPFGYVAHGEAADTDALLAAAVTVAADGVVREVAVAWGHWEYRVTYSRLGTTPPLVAPANARPLRERLRQR